MAHVTPLEALAVHPAGWYQLTATVRITCLPLVDSHFAARCGDGSGPRLFARPVQPTAERYLASIGARLPSRAELIALHEAARGMGTELAPKILTPTSEMGSLAWCREHDSWVYDQLERLGGAGVGRPVANVGKHPVREHGPARMRIFGWWDGRRYIQAGTKDQHGELHTDYATLYHGVIETPGELEGFVPATRTKASAGEVRDALTAAWRVVFAEEPQTAVIALLTAQSAFETAWWASCWCWNLLNVQRRKGHAYTTLRNVIEYVDGKPKTYSSIDFSAFASLQAGAEGWLRFMLSLSRYAESMRVLRTADAVAYCAALKAGGYYSAPLAAYTKGVQAALAELPGRLLDVAAALEKLGFADVKAFQRSAKLTPDGVVGPKTRAALVKALAALGGW